MANNAPPDLVPLLMTRPRAASERFVQSLSASTRARITTHYSPLIAIRGLGVDVSMPPSDDVIFTSANGVLHGPKGQGQTAYCVGAMTTRTAQEHGWAAIMRGQTADSLVLDLLRNPPHQNLLHLSGIHTRGDVALRLSAGGVPTKNIAVYDQIAQPLTAEATDLIAGGKPVLVPLFSPRTSAQFAIEARQTTSVHVIALSDAVARTLDPAAFASVKVATTPDADAMRAEITVALSNLSLG